MADILIGIGPKGAIKKLLHDNGDGSYSDAVFMEGVSLGDVTIENIYGMLISPRSSL